MSTTEATTSKQPDNGKAKTNVATQAAPQDDRFFSVTTNPLQYKNESCKGKPLQGRILSVEKMPYAMDQQTKEKNKAWYVFNVEATAPCQAEDNDGKLKDVKIGDVVLLPINKNLQPVYQQFKAATEAGKYVEIRVQPLTKTNLKGGKTQWEYNLDFEKPEFRSDRPKGMPWQIDSSSGGGLANAFAPTVTVRALPSAEIDDEDVPF